MIFIFTIQLYQLMTTWQSLLAMCARAVGAHPVSAAVDACVLRRRLPADCDVIVGNGSWFIVADGAVWRHCRRWKLLVIKTRYNVYVIFWYLYGISSVPNTRPKSMGLYFYFTEIYSKYPQSQRKPPRTSRPWEEPTGVKWPHW